MRIFLIMIVVVAPAGCRLKPLVSDTPGASVNILPAGSMVPSITDDVELTNQIVLANASIAMSNGVVTPGMGMSADMSVTFWSLGPMTRAPAPLYMFYRDPGTGVLEAIDHPPLLGAIPGDARYNAVHDLYQVVVTDSYDNEVFPTTDALNDAIALGLVSPPVPQGSFTNGPIVLPGTTLGGVGAGMAQPLEVYARGYAMDMFRFGGALGVQPGAILPTSQVSFLRAPMQATYDATHPVFQATIPTVAPTTKANYTPLSVVVDVDLAEGVTAATIVQDSDLFVRSAAGAITATTANVAQFSITTTILDLQLQFVAGQP